MPPQRRGDLNGRFARVVSFDPKKDTWSVWVEGEPKKFALKADNLKPPPKGTPATHHFGGTSKSRIARTARTKKAGSPGKEGEGGGGEGEGGDEGGEGGNGWWGFGGDASGGDPSAASGSTLSASERDEIRQRLYAPTKAAAAASRSKAIVTERAPASSVFESGLAADGVPVAIEERPPFAVPQGKRRSHTAKGKTSRDDKTNREKPRTFRGSPTTWAQKNRTSWEGRTTSPTGRAHPNRDRRNDVRKADLHNSINYYATARVMNKVASTGDPVYDAPDNDRKMNPASYVNSQAWFESLRHYPKGANAMDSEAAYSGLTHGPDVPTEHLETDVRTRMGIAVADPAWRPQQLQEAWAPEPPGLANRLTELRAKLRGVSVDHPDVAAAGSEHGPDMWA